MPEVLLTDGLLRKTLAAARALGREGISVAVASAVRPNPSAWSKYCQRALCSPEPRSHPGAFADWLLSELRSHDYNVLFPMDDGAMDVVVARQDDIATLTHVLVPSPADYLRLRDKWESVQLASAAGFQCPDSYCPASARELGLLAQTLSYPVVVKPRLASGSRGLRVARTAEELLQAYQEVARQYERPFIQSYIRPGERIDVCLLLDQDSRTVTSFVQRELRHFPLPHGPSTAQESIRNDALVARCIELAERARWRGIVEFEFLRDAETDELYFMESNTRFWNSVHLAILCGVNFPAYLYRLSLGEQVRPQHAYPTGVRCRSLLPADILHFIGNPARWRLKPPFFARPPEGGYDDILSWEDPVPVCGYLLLFTRGLFDGRLRRAMMRR